MQLVYVILAEDRLVLGSSAVVCLLRSDGIASISPSSGPIRRCGRKAMRRRDFICIVGSATAWPFTARAQQAGVLVNGLLGIRTAEFDAQLTTVASFHANYFLENLALRADNSVLITAMNQKELWYAPPVAATETVTPILLHTFEQLTWSFTEVEPDVFYLITSNGPRTILAADSAAGLIWRVDLAKDGSTPLARVWLRHESMGYYPGAMKPEQPGINTLRREARVSLLHRNCEEAVHACKGERRNARCDWRAGTRCGGERVRRFLHRRERRRCLFDDTPRKHHRLRFFESC
jgi:hypothetical protein